MVQSRLVVARKNTCVICRGDYIAAPLEGLAPQAGVGREAKAITELGGEGHLQVSYSLQSGRQRLLQYAFRPRQAELQENASF